MRKKIRPFVQNMYTDLANRFQNCWEGPVVKNAVFRGCLMGPLSRMLTPSTPAPL